MLGEASQLQHIAGSSTAGQQLAASGSSWAAGSKQACLMCRQIAM